MKRNTEAKKSINNSHWLQSRSSHEIKGYQIETCFGSGGCPNRANTAIPLAGKIEQVLNKEDLFSFLKERINGELRPHQEFRIAIAECPNACSQPQIKDIGIIGACIPKVTYKECTSCNACIEACMENAIAIDDNLSKPVFDYSLCINCGQCMGVCPTGTIETGKMGFRILLGGKLGRHPRLAKELPDIYEIDQVIDIVRKCIKLYKKHSTHGERFADIFRSELLSGED